MACSFAARWCWRWRRALWAAWLGVLLFGSGIGNATSLPPLIAQTEFSREDALRVVPLITALSQAAYAFAPVLFGLLRAQLEQAGQQPLRFAAAAALLQAAAMRQPGLGPGARGVAQRRATDRVTVARNGRSPADATRGCEVSAQSAAPRHRPAMTASPSSARPCATPCRSAGAVLAGFPLAFDTRDGNLDAHDGAHLRGDEIGRRVRHAPGQDAGLLLALGQGLELRAQPCRIVLDHRLAPRMHGNEIQVGTTLCVSALVAYQDGVT